MLDSKLKPWLIEVNHAPSLSTDSAFDLKIKQKLVVDTIKILNLSLKRKQLTKLLKVIRSAVHQIQKTIDYKVVFYKN